MPLTATKAGARHETDVVIIGAGPVGLFTVFECGMLKIRTHLVDTLPMIGGQCTALYPEKPIYDIPAAPAVAAGDLIERLETQAAPFQPVVHLDQQVIGLRGDAENGFVVRTQSGTEIDCKAVIIAAGGGAFGPNRPPLEGIERFEGMPHGSGVHYMVRSKEDYRDRKVVIAGGGDSALDWAIILAEVAAKVHLVHRRPKFRAAPDSVAKMETLVADGKIDLEVPYQLHGLAGSPEALDAVVVATLDGQEKHIEADALLPFFGLSTSLGPIAEWGMELQKNTIGVDQSTGATSVPGIFAVGDVATYPNKLKLILTGFAEAAQAAHACYPLVHPSKALHFEHSTDRGVPAG